MARIIKAELFLVVLTPNVKRSDAIQSFEAQETPILYLTDEENAVGTGYSYTIGQGGSAIISLLQNTLLPLIIGQDAENIERIWRMLLFSTHATTVGAITSLALATIDTALWDLKCQRANLPLFQMLGGAKNKIPIYTTEGGWLHIKTDQLVKNTIEAKEKGFKGAKIKIGKPRLKQDQERLAAVRDAVGADFEIMVDANQAFTGDQAKRYARMIAEYEVTWFEEPMPADNIIEHARLATYSPVPIAVGESLYSVSQFKDYLTTGAASIIQVDAARIGGITPWMKVAHLAEAYNAPICPHFLMELHANLCCAVPNSRWVEFIPQPGRLLKTKPVIENGFIRANQTPGNGLDWNHDKIKRMKTVSYMICAD